MITISEQFTEELIGTITAAEKMLATLLVHKLPFNQWEEVPRIITDLQNVGAALTLISKGIEP
jgi:hypothetical protein